MFVWEFEVDGAGGEHHEGEGGLRGVDGLGCVALGLVQMDARLAAGGDSGGPVFWGNTAYGFHQGYVYDVWPADRDVFSRSHRIDDTLGVVVASS